jgi:hypothetical protein
MSNQSVANTRKTRVCRLLKTRELRERVFEYYLHGHEGKIAQVTSLAK